MTPPGVCTALRMFPGIPPSPTTHGGDAVIIDLHTHHTPPGMLEALIASGDEPYWRFIMTPDPKNQTEQDFVTIERMLDDMTDAGVDAVVIQAGYQQSSRGTRQANDAVLAIAQRYPDRVIPFVSLPIADRAAARDELRRTVELGARGVGEVNPYAQGFSLDSAEFRAVADECSGIGIPLTLHMSEEAGRFYFGRTTGHIGDYYEFAASVPELKLILAHWGGGLFFYEMMPLVAHTLAHVVYDTAASPLLYPTDKVFPVALGCMPATKIAYGSDYPLRITHEQDGATFAPFLDQLAAVPMSDEDRAQILSGTAERVLDRTASARLPIESDPEIAEEYATARTLADRLELPLDPFMPVRRIAQRYPRTRSVFERYGIPHTDSPVPVWEPIIQSAAARGLGEDRQAELLDELNRAVGS